ncbi:MAG: lamin tail domain-containing protein [Saprospiraceae bacterium]
MITFLSNSHHYEINGDLILHILPCLFVCGFLLSAKWPGISSGIDNDSEPITCNGKWEGDTSHFTFEPNGDFHLNAEKAGRSYIYKNYSFSEAMRWSLKLKLNFAPSLNNRLRIILASLDSLAESSAFILEIGETGTMDALELYHYADGVKTLMARSSNGIVAKAFELNIEVHKTEDGLWILHANMPGENSCNPEFTYPFESDIIQEMAYIGFELNYTSSNRDAFYFSNMEYEPSYPDWEAPGLLELELIEGQSMILHFDERIQSETGVIWLSDELGNIWPPDTIHQDSLYCDRLHLTFNTGLDPIHLYNLNILDILDMDGNSADIYYDSIRYNPSPGPQELLINEILFDPFPGLDDFVELYNPTRKFLQLKGLELCNANKSDCNMIPEDLILDPSAIIAFSPDPNELKIQYKTPDEAWIVEQDLPGFNNDSGNISLRVDSQGNRLTVDSFDYTREMHFNLIMNPEGVSLERLSADASSNSPQNWYSGVESSHWATPGYRNSNSFTDKRGLSSFTFQNDVFSPDGDGFQDLLIFNYSLENTHYIAYCWVLNSWGALHKQIANSELTSQTGIISWDGLDRFERPSPMGIYVLYYEFVHASGNRITGKKAFVLAYRI